MKKKNYRLLYFLKVKYHTGKKKRKKKKKKERDKDKFLYSLYYKY